METIADEDWVICFGETRTVTNGMVVCPGRGGQPASVDICTECHLLTWRHDERSMRTACAVGADEPLSSRP